MQGSAVSATIMGGDKWLRRGRRWKRVWEERRRRWVGVGRRVKMGLGATVVG